MNTPYPSRLIFLDSQYRSSGTISNAIFHFNDFIQVPYFNISLVLSLKDMQISLSNYNINNNSNTFIYSMNGGEEQTINLTNGNYSAYELRNHINGLQSDIVLTYDSITNKYTFSSSSQEFTILKTSSCLREIGLTKVDHNSVSLSLTSDTVVDLSGITSIYLIINNIITNSLDSRTGRSHSTILDKVGVDIEHNGVLSFVNSGYKTAITDKKINFIELTLEDQNRNEIDFNNLETAYHITLQIDFIYLPVVQMDKTLMFSKEEQK